MKLLQLMWSGVKKSFKENRNWILMLIFAFGSILIFGGIGKLLSDNDGIVLLITIIGFILTMVFFTNYLHYLEAKEYSKEHNVSFEIAWENTKPDDEDCF